MAITPINLSQLVSSPNASTAPYVPPPTLASKVGGFLNNTIIQPIKNAVTGGAQKIQQGTQQVQQAPQQGGVGGFVSGLEGGAKQVAGALEGGGALLAPIFNVISTVLQGNPNKANIMSQIVNNPDIQKFAMSGPGKTTARVAQDIGNVATIAGAGAGLATMTNPEIPSTETPPAETTPTSSSKGTYDTNLSNATIANNQAGTAATNSIHEASNVINDVNTGLGNQFSQAPEIIAKADPSAKVILPADFVDKLNALKDTKAFSLPDYIREPNLPSDIKNIGSGERVLNPAQAQDLATQLNDLKFNSKGDVVVNQQTGNLVNQLKTLNQSALGHVVDAQGNSVWGQAYSDYQMGKNAMDSMSNLIPTKSSSGSMLDPIKVNDSVNKMMKMMETPQGTQALVRANTDFKAATGYDLLNDPMGAINKLAESNEDVAKALKGSFGHQFIEGLKNPSMLSRRAMYVAGGAVTTILGITALSAEFRKQIGTVLSGQ